MSIEFKIQSVMVDSQELQDIYPDLIPSINNFLQSHYTPKKRKPRKKKITVAVLIDDIINDIQTK